MKFLKQSVEQAIPAIAECIIQMLHNDKTVLWLVCGGSNIRAQVKVMQVIQSHASERAKNLIILPMDERFGPAGHPDSNYRQMSNAGFNAGNATWTDVLARELPFAETVEYYGTCVEDAFAKADYVIGTFGMGADGHTAGVLPYSPALSETVVSVVGYTAPGFVRMTMTPTWLVRCDISFVLSYGPEKAIALQNLREHALSLEAMPAGLHYEIANATIYNDHIGDEVTQ